MAKRKENTSAKHSKKETAEANDKRTSVKASSETLKVRITGPVAWLGYPYNIGQEKTLPKNQAEELIENGVAEKI
ncbi:hypothetical protein [Terasakiella sp.]|uniref:hypothetical protein n=1 Tax=Terasakiella sp. TaxID=2034861 RepID=UPI003AA92943